MNKTTIFALSNLHFPEAFLVRDRRPSCGQIQPRLKPHINRSCGCGTHTDVSAHRQGETKLASLVASLWRQLGKTARQKLLVPSTATSNLSLSLPIGSKLCECLSSVVPKRRKGSEPCLQLVVGVASCLLDYSRLAIRECLEVSIEAVNITLAHKKRMNQ